MKPRMKCTLCGYEFDEGKALTACVNCPIAKGCRLIRCPNCGFETPPEPKWLKSLSRLRIFSRPKMPDKGKEIEMTKLNVNQKAKVIRIATHDHKKLQKIMAMGIFPGATVALIQKFPSYVFQTGQSQFAVDKELASCIYVRLKD